MTQLTNVQPSQDEPPQNDTAQNDTAQNHTAQSDATQNDTAQSDAVQNDPVQNYPATPIPPEIEHDPVRDPADWVTGGEPSTGPQESYIRTLAKEAGEEVPTGLTKAEASETIDHLQAQTGRGSPEPPG